MKGLILAALLVSTLLWTRGATAAPEAAQGRAICQDRATCTITETHDGGTSAAGAALTVVEVQLGLADKPDDQPGGCRTSDRPDGGVEFWLLGGTAAPR